MEKILISRCFLGDIVRYDGVEKALSHQLITHWKNENRLIGICPEVSGGLPVPREPAEINPLTNRIITVTNIDVTDAFEKGAHLALAQCKKHNLKYALLKESSPSCGSQYIYDGSFSNKKIKGQGITTRLLEQAGIKVFSENTIEILAQYMS